MKVGIVGGGQLGQMMALAGIPLGHRFSVFDPVENPCAAVCARHVRASFDDREAMQNFAREVDVLTYEFENVNVDVLDEIAQQMPVWPPVEAVRVSSDRLAEKSLFVKLGIPTAPFAAVSDRDSMLQAVQTVGLPMIVKTRRLGYDGKGQRIVRRLEEIDEALAALDYVECIAEAWVDFRREVSLVLVREQDGNTQLWSACENVHVGGILRETSALVGVPLDGSALHRAREYAESLARHLDYCGVLTLELFDCGEAGFLANEFAPRVHNSGHWTQNGSSLSQFEAHVRAVTQSSVPTIVDRWSAMLNFVGAVPEGVLQLPQPSVHLHLYGKESREGRKVGHLNLVADSKEELEATSREVKRALRWSPK